MEMKITICEICGKRAENEQEKREDNWLKIQGGSIGGIRVWLEKSRVENTGCYMHHVGWQERTYDFCSIKCLVSALEQKESI